MVRKKTKQTSKQRNNNAQNKQVLQIKAYLSRLLNVLHDQELLL